MKLAILGGVTAAIGLWLDVHGLMGIGAYWVLVGPVMRRHAQQLQAAQRASEDQTPPMDGRTFAVGTALWMLLGVPSLLVGALQLGIDADHANWRWLPLAVGALALGVGGVAAVLYLLGSAATAAVERMGTPELPATVWIRAVRETGTYINERPRMEFEFRVEPDAETGLPPYDVTKKATVPFTALSGIRVGDGFKASVAGVEHPTTMEIHWDQSVRGPSGD